MADEVKMVPCDLCGGQGQYSYFEPGSHTATVCKCGKCGTTGQIKESPTFPCIIEGCGKIAKWKGLCGSCYYAAKQAVAKNEYTWAELAKMGLAIEEEKPFERALRLAREKKLKDSPDTQ
jgi:hypothetical protein